jgi:hypothetical protein
MMIGSWLEMGQSKVFPAHQTLKLPASNSKVMAGTAWTGEAWQIS